MMSYMPFVTGIAVVFCIFVLPLWIIFNYLGKSKASGVLSKEDERMLEDLWKMSKEMEGRIENLETILDHDSNTWSKKK